MALIFEVPAVAVSTYPTLVGLSFTFLKRPKFNTNIGTHVSGREIRIGMWKYPMWEWELTYDYLPDFNPMFGGSANSDLRKLLGFYLSMQGPLTTFLFKDPDDNAIVQGATGTGDGSTTVFTLMRTYGFTGAQGSEPIGYVDLTQTFALYVGGVLQNPLNYSVSQTTLYSQTVTFTSPPALNAAITVTMSYLFAVRFKDDMDDYEKFANQLWQLKKVTLMSARQ
jgi:uncharacterized protein (TIGR02217 family)